jgi:hypothetical protein
MLPLQRTQLHRRAAPHLRYTLPPPLPTPNQLPTPAPQAAGPTFGSAAEAGYDERVKGSGRASSPASASYAAAAPPASLLLGGGQDDGPVVSPAAREVLRVVFSKDGSYAQASRARARTWAQQRR